MGNQERIATGVPGLDEIVEGGLPPNALYLLKGQPGTGKTTMGLQLLLEGARRGERCLYVCLAETTGQLTGIAKSYGWSLEGIEVHEVRHAGGEIGRAGYTVFSPSEVELEDIAHNLIEQFERFHPTRLVLDSLSEIRLLAEYPSRYRRELLTLIDRIGPNCTGWLIDVETTDRAALVAETLVSGVVVLEQLSPAYGGERRRLRVRKLRASSSIGGYHDFAIRQNGLEVYPRLVAAAHRSTHSSAAVPSGVSELDALLGGGIDGGTSTVLMGPSGTGKSTIAAQFVASAAARGLPAVMFSFDESLTNLLVRTNSLGIPLREQAESGMVRLLAIDPAEFTPGELADRIRTYVAEGARIVVIDSVNGYMNALPEERFISAHLHELLAFLAEKGVATILTIAQHGFLGESDPPVQVTYVADTAIVFRYLEAAGQVKLALSVVKKRTGSHGRTIHELQFNADGAHLGPPLTHFQGILSGGLPYDQYVMSRGTGEPSK